MASEICSTRNCDIDGRGGRVSAFHSSTAQMAMQPHSVLEHKLVFLLHLVPTRLDVSHDAIDLLIRQVVPVTDPLGGQSSFT